MPLIPLIESDILATHTKYTNEHGNIIDIYNPISRAIIRDKINITRDDPRIKRSLDGHPGRINTDSYDRIYINSDIRSDYRNFISCLQKLNLIKIPTGLNIYSYQLITDTEWLPHNTLYVIIGDLVNGRQQQGFVSDQIGSFDILLHMFIYNLRLKALEKNSDILFTIGCNTSRSCRYG